MAIIGNKQTATKFYITNSKGSIEWVPSLALAQEQVEDPTNTEWYKKDIYCTNEKFVLDNEGLVCLKSKLSKAAINERNLQREFAEFKEQAQKYVDSKLLEFATSHDYESIYSMVSWKNSSNETFAADAELAIEYRDKVYAYHFDYINDTEEKIKTMDTVETLENVYSSYIEGFPTE